MKNTNKIWFLLFILVFATACSPDGDNDNDILYAIPPPAVLANVSTLPATAVTQNAATAGGIVTNDNNTTVTERGICWATTELPTITNNKVPSGNGVGNFTANITGLAVSTLYYFRAYATNAAGTAYGNQLSFTTAATAVLPEVNTNTTTAITATSFSCENEVTTDGGSPVTERGIAYGTATNPTIAGTKTIDGSGIGIFNSSITGLTTGTTYYVRAYATNSLGTAYGDEISFVAL